MFRYRLRHLLFFLLLSTFVFNPSINIGVNLSIADAIIFALLILTLTQTVKIKRFIGFYNFSGIYILLTSYYMFLIFYSFFVMQNEYQAVFGRFRNLYVYSLPFFSGMILTKSRADVQKYIDCLEYFLIGGIFLGFINIFKPISLFGLPIFGGTSYAMVMVPEIGLFAIFIMIYSLLNYLFQKRKMINAGYVVIVILAIIGSQNRSLLVCALLALCLTSFYAIRIKRINVRLIKVGIIILVVAGASFLILANTQSWNLFEKRYKRIVTEISGEREFTQFDLRISRAIETLKSWAKHPIIGAGWGSHISEYVLYRPDKQEYRTWKGTPHNYYAALLEQTGLIGFSIMMYFFWCIFVIIKPHQRLNANTVISYSFFLFFIVLLIFNFANVFIYSTINFIAVCFFLFGTIVANSSFERNQVLLKNAFLSAAALPVQPTKDIKTDTA